MPRSKHLKIIIAPDGSCAVDAINFTGPSCKVATIEIANALGVQVGHQHDKPEARIRDRYGDAERQQAR